MTSLETDSTSRWIPLPIGRAELDVPGDWELVEDGTAGHVILRLPLDEDAELIDQPGFVHPNIVLSYLERTAESGGVAAVAAESLEASRREIPGLVALHVTPFTTDSGLPGRAQLVAGMSHRSSFEQLRSYVGVENTVVEVVLTIPTGFQAAVMDTAQEIAQSIRDRTDARTKHRGSVPHIHPAWLDAALTEIFQRARKAAPAVPDLERNNLKHLGGPVRRGIPTSAGRLSRPALELLQTVADLGSTTRLGAGSTASDVEELTALGLWSDHRLTEAGEHLMSGVDGAADVTVSGRVYGHSTRADAWFDGDEVTVILGPSSEDLHDGYADRCYVMREWNRSLPVILAWWCGLETDWYEVLEAEVDQAELDRLTSREGSVCPSDTASLHVRETLSGRWGAWQMTGPLVHYDARWLCTESRGTLALTDAAPGRFKVEAMSADSIYYRLLALVRGVLEGKQSR